MSDETPKPLRPGLRPGWAKGVSGNPGGKPKAEKEVLALMRGTLNQKRQRLEKLCRHESPAIQLAALKLYFAYAIGLPKQTVDVKSTTQINVVQPYGGQVREGTVVDAVRVPPPPRQLDG